MAGNGSRALVAGLREVLRLHRRLPSVQRSLGDRVAMEEARAIVAADKAGKASAAHWGAFAAEWRGYAAMLRGEESHLADTSEASLLETLSAEQRAQLMQLREETSRLKGAEPDG